MTAEAVPDTQSAETDLNTGHLLSAWMQVDPHLGASADAFLQHRRHPDVRRVLAAILAKPTVRRFQVRVDYDRPEFRLLDRQIAGVFSIDDVLRPEHFPITWKGIATIDVVEFWPTHPMSIDHQIKLFKQLQWRIMCRAEAQTTIDRLSPSSYPIKAVCGPPFVHPLDAQSNRPWFDQMVPSVAQTTAGRLYTATRLHQQTCQTTRVLAVLEG